MKQHSIVLGICLTIAACNSSSSSSADSGSSGGGGVSSVDSHFSAWVSSTQAEITFPADLSGNYLLYSSQDPSCDIASYLLCNEGQQTPLDTFPASVTIRAWTLTTPAYYILENRDTDTRKTTNTNNIVPSTQIFSARDNHQVVVFDDSIYLIGGVDSKGNNDVWRSSNSTDWTLVEASADFSVRTGHQVVEFKDSMYLIGGIDTFDGIANNDVWRSSNGADWTLVEASADFPARYNHQLVVFKDTMYLIGGKSHIPDRSTGDGILYNDVWSSVNARDWTRDAVHADFPARTDYQVVVFKESMYLIGGSSKNDVWRSSNGADWMLVEASADFSVRYGHQVVALDTKMYLIGGISTSTGDSGLFRSELLNDVWSSSDGKDWTEDTADAAFSARGSYQVVVFKDSMYLIGGFSLVTSAGAIVNKKQNDIWRSTDGSDWLRGYSGTFVFE